jgi:glycosyltransferase involved in cell wall biosynthesis
MALFSIIVPSFNQDKYIKETLENLLLLKTEAKKNNIGIQVILVDNCSDAATQEIITAYRNIIDDLFIENDKGQYDAINKGLKRVKGDYWTWLNTDDMLDLNGFLKLATYLQQHKNTDYIYGDVRYIDEHSDFHKTSTSGELSLKKLIRSDASISQPGSFFKTTFTHTIGELAPFNFAFDYEYILRCLKHNAVVVKLNTTVAHFRYYAASKSGSKDYRFLKEQLMINRQYGGRLFYKLGLMLNLRILKRKIFN